MFVKKAWQAKILFGQGLDKTHNSETYAYEIHTEYRKPKYLLKVKVFNKDDILSADLIHMPNESDFKYA